MLSRTLILPLIKNVSPLPSTKEVTLNLASKKLTALLPPHGSSPYLTISLSTAQTHTGILKTLDLGFSGYVSRAKFASMYGGSATFGGEPAYQKDQRAGKPQTYKDMHTDLFWKVYISIVRRVVETGKIYLRASPKEREAVDERSRFGYMKKVIDNLSQVKQEDMLEYMESLTTLYGTSHRSQITAFLKDRHEGPTMLKLMLEFLDSRNRDFLYYVSEEKMDERDIGEMGEKKKVLEEEERNELMENLEAFRSYFKQIQEGKIRGL